MLAEALVLVARSACREIARVDAARPAPAAASGRRRSRRAAAAGRRDRPPRSRTASRVPSGTGPSEVDPESAGSGDEQKHAAASSRHRLPSARRARHRPAPFEGAGSAGEGDDLTPQSVVMPPSRRPKAPTSPPVGGIRPLHMSVSVRPKPRSIRCLCGRNDPDDTCPRRRPVAARRCPGTPHAPRRRR